MCVGGSIGRCRDYVKLFVCIYCRFWGKVRYKVVCRGWLVFLGG